ncbi:unnamed protein product [Diatraea saccharalis]|uniref:Uncharacterized protein n=1 Tax=Diatraea saccharalis TaxID=40085 RepID=A0A9N9WLY3_9NEOP|nr:unnamed protein product [Diatraea saccharalis]
MPGDPPLPPPSPAPSPAPSRLRRTLNSLRSPFRSGSPFHIGSIKRSMSTKSFASDGEITRDERTMRKRNKKHREVSSDASRSTDSSPSVDKKKKEGGGSFIRRMGSIGKKRVQPARVDSAERPVESAEKSLESVESGSTSTPTPPPHTDTVESTMEGPPTPPPEASVIEAAAVEQEQQQIEPETPVPPVSVSPIAVEHPVATLPFTKAAWKKRSELEMEKPVEEPSPGSALKRRIAFVAQASACLSEDRDDGEERGESEVGSLEEAVALARVRLAVPSAPSPAHSRDTDTEEEGCTDAMPAYGDLIEPECKPGPDGGGQDPVSESAVGTGGPSDARAP